VIFQNERKGGMTIKRIDPRSLSKVLAVLYGLLGVIAGVIFALVGSLSAGFGTAMPFGFGALFGVLGLILWPICYALIGWIGGWVVASLYNWVAGRFGGIVLDTQ
jgi:hypothetical protein